MEEQNVQKLRQRDAWEEKFPRGAENELIQSVVEMEANSEWIHGIKAKDIQLTPLLNGPFFLPDQIKQYHLQDADLASDTAENGTELLIYTGERMDADGSMYALVRDTAISGIHRVARLNGNSLGDMTRQKYCTAMNYGFETAKGKALGLMRYGKLSGLQSGADGGYMIMPISKLLNVTADVVTRRFGHVELREGHNTHGFTRALWELPDAQDRLIDMYQKAIEKSGYSSQYAINFMPGVDFHSSDTASSAAALNPVFFLPGGATLSFVEGVKVKHLRRGDAKEKDGIELFEEGADKIFAKFEDAAKMIAKLSGIRIRHAGNCCILLCRRYNVSPKYGQAAWDELEQLSSGELDISAHDFYIGMTEVLSEAERRNASAKKLAELEDFLAKIPRTDLSVYDVSGTVSWDNTRETAND